VDSEDNRRHLEPFPSEIHLTLGWAQKWCWWSVSSSNL